MSSHAPELPDARHVYHIYAVRSRDRDALQQSLQARGIQTGLHYPIPVHLQPAHRDLGYREGRVPALRSSGARGAVAAALPRNAARVRGAGRQRRLRRPAGCLLMDTRPGLHNGRLTDLMRSAIERCNLDLSGLTVLTEAATGAYVVTPVIAAMAGARRVLAVTQSTRYGTVDEVRSATLELARHAGVADRIGIEIVTGKEPGHRRAGRHRDQQRACTAD